MEFQSEMTADFVSNDDGGIRKWTDGKGNNGTELRCLHPKPIRVIRERGLFEINNRVFIFDSDKTTRRALVLIDCMVLVDRVPPSTSILDGAKHKDAWKSTQSSHNILLLK